MADKWQTINTFFSGFGIAAYDAATVPEDAVFPRITYSVSVDSIGFPTNISANLWYRTTSWKDISKKADEIGDYVDHMYPASIKIDNGRLYIAKGHPFAQRVTDPDDMIRRIYLNFQVEFLTN